MEPNGAPEQDPLLRRAGAEHAGKNTRARAPAKMSAVATSSPRRRVTIEPSTSATAIVAAAGRRACRPGSGRAEGAGERDVAERVAREPCARDEVADAAARERDERPARSALRKNSCANIRLAGDRAQRTAKGYCAWSPHASTAREQVGRDATS
jgi:hypothetical protein